MLNSFSLRVNVLLLFVCSITIVPIQAQPIDSSKSKATFKIDNAWINSVEGEFTGMDGTLLFNPSDLSNAKMDVCIDASTVNTENDKRDEHLRSADFFEVQKYPEICFTSHSIEKTNKGFVARGQLSMHGVSKEVEIPFTYSDNILTGSFELNRLEYKVGEDFSSFLAGNDVKVTIICVLK